MKNGTAISDIAEPVEAAGIRISGQFITLLFADGREMKAPLDLYPTLKNAPRQARERWRLIGRGVGIHWPDLDLDLLVEGMIRGEPESFPPPPPLQSVASRPDYVVKKAGRGWGVFMVQPVTDPMTSKLKAKRLVRELSAKHAKPGRRRRSMRTTG